MVLARLIAAIVALLATTAPASAHLTPNSEIVLTVHPDRVDADIVVPQGEYAYATGNPARNDATALAKARAYLQHHVAVRAPDGREWRVDFGRVAFEQIAGPPDLHATARLVPPVGAGSRRFNLYWSALLGELPSHFALVVLAGDSEGSIGTGRQVLGAVRAGQPSLDVDLGAPSGRAAFANAVLLGIDHIAHGYDHLLFLIALLLPAPLIARGGRWAEPRPVRSTLGKLLKIVTAFTIGHSLTLVGATLGGWHLPAAPVEIAIAVSVLVSAIHAIRPLVPGREHWVAVGFGLVHGLAFATLLHDAGAGEASTALSLVGFNVGIEIVQLAIVALVVPPLIVLSRAPRFALLRVTLASLAALAAVVWIANRAFGIAGPLVAAIESVLQQGWVGVVALYVMAALTHFSIKRNVHPETV